MAWACAATVQTVDEIASIVPTHPGDSRRPQFEAALRAAALMAIGTGPWTVTATGNGQSYPTSRVTIMVASYSGSSVSQQWTATGDLGSGPDVKNLVPEPALQPGLTTQQFAAAKNAAQSLIASRTIGDVDHTPYVTTCSGETGLETATITVMVHHPVGEGHYQGPVTTGAGGKPV